MHPVRQDPFQALSLLEKSFACSKTVIDYSFDECHEIFRTENCAQRIGLCGLQLALTWTARNALEGYKKQLEAGKILTPGSKGRDRMLNRCLLHHVIVNLVRASRLEDALNGVICEKLTNYGQFWKQGMEPSYQALSLLEKSYACSKIVIDYSFDQCHEIFRTEDSAQRVALFEHQLALTSTARQALEGYKIALTAGTILAPSSKGRDRMFNRCLLRKVTANLVRVSRLQDALFGVISDKLTNYDQFWNALRQGPRMSSTTGLRATGDCARRCANIGDTGDAPHDDSTDSLSVRRTRPIANPLSQPARKMTEPTEVETTENAPIGAGINTSGEWVATQSDCAWYDYQRGSGNRIGSSYVDKKRCAAECYPVQAKRLDQGVRPRCLRHDHGTIVVASRLVGVPESQDGENDEMST